MASEPVETNPTSEDKATDTHLSGWSLWSVLLGLFLVVLIVTLDISIVAVAVPSITNEFNTLKDIAWYVSAFLICQCTLIPLAGRTYTYFPFKVCFISFLVMFEVGSLVCGLANSSSMLVVGRAICGLGSSGLINGALAIVNIAAPPGKRAMAMGIFMAVASLGQVIGPLVGGGLTQHVSWRWCFYLNLPVGGAAVAAFLFIRFPATEKKIWTSKTLFWDLDMPGFAIFAPASIMLLLGLTWGGNEYAWNSATIIGLLCGAVAISIIFIFWELRQQDRAMLPPPLLKLRPIYSASITGFIQGGSMLVLIYYIVLWFQVSKNASPSMSGVYTLPSFLSQVLFAIITGIFLSRVPYALPPLLLGNALNIISYGLTTAFIPSSPTGHWIGYQIIAGAGRGMTLQTPLLVAQNAVPKIDVPLATSVLVWCQFFGGAVFIAIAQVVFISALRTAFAQFVPELDVDAAIHGGATAFIAGVQGEGQRDAVLRAYNQAITRTFYLGLALAATAMVTSVGIWTAKVETGIGKKPEESVEEVREKGKVEAKQ